MVIDIKPRRFAFRAIGRLSECGGGKREREMLTREMSQKLSVAAAFLLPLLVHSVPIDNGVAGRPWISCENDMIILNARTEKPFVGRVFVKGMSKNAECAREYNEPIDTSAELQISMGSCQMRRQRYIEPAGMQQSIIVIVSFHPVFLTKVDMAYNIRCFYMTRPITLSQSIEVSMLTPTDLYSEEAMTPKCEYTIRLDSKEGPLAQYAVVGQTLFHVWRCETAPTDGILVKNCVIRDNSNMVYNALDDLGCPADKHVVGSLSYNAELNEAYVEVHAFKFADEPNLFFQCEITFCARSGAESETRPSTQSPCDGVSPPNCEPSTEPMMPSIAPPVYGGPFEQQAVNKLPDEKPSKPLLDRLSTADDIVKLRLTYPTTTSGRASTRASTLQRPPRAISGDSGWTMDVVPQNDYLVVLDMIESEVDNTAPSGVASRRPIFQSRPLCEVGWRQRVALIVSCCMAMTMTVLSGLLTTYLCVTSMKQSKERWTGR